MKVTAILPDDLIQDVKEFTGGKNITESLKLALSDWLYQKRIERLDQQLSENPVQFHEHFDAETIRNLNNRNDRS